MPAILYYVSGHGFGHARRCAETIKLLKQRRPDIQVHVRTMANPDVFAGCDVNHKPVPIDRGAVEIDALTIDWRATLSNVRELMAQKDRLISDEANYIREQRVKLIIADVPFMAGYVAERAGVPCYAQCNFMWDWIYEPHTDDLDLLEFIRGGYRRMTAWLRLPFPHECAHFRSVQDVPFIISPLMLSPTQARQRLGISEDERRPVVLIGMRGGTDDRIIEGLKKIADRYLFITIGGQVFGQQAPCGPLRFWDALQICEAVVSKPGHGIVTDCATEGVGLLYPKRNGFREDAMILREGETYFRQQAIPLEDYASGNWAPHLEALLAQEPRQPASNTNGREFVVDFIESRLGTTG